MYCVILWKPRHHFSFTFQTGRHRRHSNPDEGLQRGHLHTFQDDFSPNHQRLVSKDSSIGDESIDRRFVDERHFHKQLSKVFRPGSILADSVRSSKTAALGGDLINLFGVSSEVFSSHPARKLIDGSSSKMLQCHICSYQTQNKSHMKYHSRTHTGDKPFKCPHCPHRASHQSNLKRHVMVHFST